MVLLKEAPKKAAPKKKKGDSDSEIELDDSMESVCYFYIGL